MTLRLAGSTSGYTEIEAPAVAGSNTLVLPTGNGSADQALVTNGSGTLSFADRGRMTLATAQNSTSGTSIDFTGIPSWVKKITVMFNGVSTNGTNGFRFQIGSGSVETSGYVGTSSVVGDGSVTGVLASGTSGLDTWVIVAANLYHGQAVFLHMGSNIWSLSVSLVSNEPRAFFSAGTKTTSGVLDRLRITTTGGTNTFDAGSINILYEG
jgi:hypothetical protein